MKKMIIFKIFFLSVVYGLIKLLGLFISPLIENSLAMSQMSYSFESNLLVQVYDYVSNYSWIIYLLLVILVFHKEILKIYKSLKETKEKTNEEN